MQILRHVVQNAVNVLLVTWISTICVGRIWDFHRAYIEIIDKKNTEEWLRTQCQDDYFYHKLAYHSTLCEEVANNAKISPVLYAISESAAQMKMCGLYDCTSLLAMISAGGFPVLICIFLVYVLTPSFLLPFLQNSYERYSSYSLDQRCSPYHKETGKRRKHADWQNSPYPASDAITNHVKYV